MKKTMTFIALVAVLALGACKKHGTDVNPVDPDATTGTASVKPESGRTECGWVQLWNYGPKFAEFSVGATISSYGQLSHAVETYKGWKTDYCTENVGGLYPWYNQNVNGRKTTWKDDDYFDQVDIAKAIWGNNWREPTMREFEQLVYDAANPEEIMTNPTGYKRLGLVWTWCDGSTVQYCEGCTLAGMAVSGEPGSKYENNRIFLPATGEFTFVTIVDGNPQGGDVEGAGTFGAYWSGTLKGGSSAGSMGFGNTQPEELGYTYHRYGLAVRPVLAK